MLKTIIKRDGTNEEFMPHKVNQWAIWAGEKLKGRVDWSGVVLDAIRGVGDSIYSQDLQDRLIKACLSRKDWPHNLMAGKLYSAITRKELFNGTLPTVKEQFSNMVKIGQMIELPYDDNDYLEIEKIIDHSRDFDLAYQQVKQLRSKYSLQDKRNKKQYETPQFTYMRMAAHLASLEPKETRLMHLKNYYDHFSFNRINCPTPNYNNLGTKHRGYSSCCLYSVADNADSLAVGDHIAYKMTLMSAGVGGYIDTRSSGDPVRGGAIVHSGKLPYYNSLAGAVKANTQGGRGGACTMYYSAFDPEASTIVRLQNPRSTEDAKNRDIHFAMMTNRLIAKRVRDNEMIFTFNSFTAPDLHKAFFSGDQDYFEELYRKYECDDSFVKNYVDARKLVVFGLMQQSYEVGTNYWMDVGECNRNTPFKDPLYSSNLCTETLIPTKPYSSILDLYSEELHHDGEVGMCNLAAIVEPNIHSDEMYASAAYYCLKTIDRCIELSDYPLAHVGVTSKARLNAGVGLVGAATTMARGNLKYDSLDGRNKLHEMAERHAYFVIKASLQLGKELGNAPWIDKTKWPDGWLPIDTYKKTVDSLVTVGYKYDWETLRKEIIANKGIRNSSVILHPPTESSSKASGVPNSWYPVRELAMKKSDLSNTIEWCAMDSDILGDSYQTAWSVDPVDMIKVYAIVQKFTDQSISADMYADRTSEIEIKASDMLNIFLNMVKYGMKSRYYQNTRLSSNSAPQQEKGCASGACTL